MIRDVCERCGSDNLDIEENEFGTTIWCHNCQMYTARASPIDKIRLAFKGLLKR